MMTGGGEGTVILVHRKKHIPMNIYCILEETKRMRFLPATGSLDPR